MATTEKLTPKIQEEYVNQIATELDTAVDGAALLAAMQAYDLETARSNDRVRQALAAYQNVRATNIVDGTKIGVALGLI